MAFRITAAHEAPTVDFEIAIKGRQNPMLFSVPKMQYLPRDIADIYAEWFKEQVEKRTATDRICNLKILELLLPKRPTPYSNVSPTVNSPRSRNTGRPSRR
ncbi:hypothetical protein GS426_12330 [Rhodococcus hoagii]|nr:hypothetical protein [Prescottella equi]